MAEREGEPTGRVISVNVGRARPFGPPGRAVPSGFLKAPVAGPVRVGPTQVEGDEQADRRVHGGPRKAVYLYPSEHYTFWRAELPGVPLPWGSFGENLTIEGLVEGSVRLGETLEVGTAILEVTQPRFPCFKLGLRFGSDAMVRRFTEAGRSGFYAAVRRPGTFRSGDPIHRTPGPEAAPTVLEAFRRETEGADG